MSEKQGWVRITRTCIIAGQNFEAGARVKVDADLFRRLVREGLAAPSAGPGRMFTSDVSGFADAPGNKVVA